jgi:CSLREA domain-containing protein
MNASITPPEPGSSRPFRFSSSSNGRNVFRLLIRLISVAILAAGLAAGSIRPAFALTITVNTTADEAGTGASCSLREAIYSANTDTAYGGCATGGGSDTIVLAAGATYDLGTTPAVSSTAFGPSAFAITSTIVISGNGATLTRSGTASARFFYVGAAGNLTLFNLTVSNGRHVGGNGGNGAGGGGGAAGMGGAIFNEGTVTLDRSTFTGNTAIGGNGGNGSTSTTGTGGGGGGGMGANGAAVANGTCASPTTGGNGGGPNGGTGGAAPTAGTTGGGGGGGNSDASGGSCGNGNGVSGANGGFGGGGSGGGSDASGGNSGNGGNSGFGGGGGGAGAEADMGSSGNAGSGGDFGGDGRTNGGPGGGGAGLGGVLFNLSGSVVIRNSTFSGNATQFGTNTINAAQDRGLSRGGAIFNRNGALNINNATFSANTSDDGAIYNLGDGAAANLTLRNSIVANSVGGDDCFSTSINAGSQTVMQTNNVIENDTNCGTPTSTADPQLAALATNGGSTQTHAIPTTSPAYNAGSNATCETTDQRGIARPQGANCEIGAYEVVLSITGLAAQNSSPTRLTNTTFFTATVTGGTGVTYQWNFGDGSAVVSGANVNRIYTTAGAYTAIVTATNFNGSVATTTPVTITNSAPAANAGPDQTVSVNATVNLNGTGSTDPDNHTPLTYGWTQTGGPAVTLSSATAASPSFTSPTVPESLTFQLTVTDAQGLADPTPDTVVITVNDIAIGGLAAQGSTPTRLTDATFFTATTSAGTNVVYTWNFGDGSPTVNGATVNYVYGATGSYTAIVTATNGQGSASETTTVNVTNAAPVANAGVDQTVNAGANVTLNGAGSSDPDGHTPLTYGWTQTSGPAVTLSSPTAASPSFTAPGSLGALTFQLAVTDSTGLADATPDEVTITVGDAPITGLSATSSTPTRLTDATLFTATITGGTNVAYTWNFGNGSPTATGGNVNYTYAAAGNYTAIVTATNTGGSSTTTTNVVVTNQAPVANAGADQSAMAGTTVNLNGSASADPDNHAPLSYGWIQTGGPAVTLIGATTATPSFTAPGAPGVLTFALTVTDAQGLADASPDEVVITITDVPIAGLSAANSSPTRLASPTLFTATIGAGTSVVYTWNFGDGSPAATGLNASRTYAAVGIYTAIVTATNGVSTVSATTLVTITNDPPVANAGADQTVDVNTTVTLNGAASADPDNHTPLAYLWQQTSGPAVVLSNNAASAPTFTAPTAPTVLTFTLAVTDSTGLADATPDEVVVRVQDAAIGGLSAASSSPTRLTDSTFFTATILAGSNVSYEWAFGDGSPTRAGQTVTHTYALAGNYTAVVTATNSRGAVSATTLVVVVNQAPIADAGADQTVSIGGNVSLIGSASADPDNHLPLSYTWQQVGGPAVTLNNTNSVSPTFTAPGAPGVLTFALVVTDAQGAADATPDQVVINVIDIGISGLSAQSSSPTRLTDATAFTATITSGSGATYSWNFGDSTPAVVGETASHVYAAPGTYVAVVTAQNGFGSVTASTLVVVTNQAPVANAGSDQAVVVGANVTLNGDSSSDPDNHVPLVYAWQQTGGPVVTLSNVTSSAPSFTAPAAPAVLTFTLAVTDAQGAADGTPDEVVVTVSDAPVAGLSASNSGPTIIGQATQLAAAITGGTNVSYVWDFGDGSPTVSDAVSYTYAAIGSYTATVTATNSAGSASATTVVVVKDVPVSGLAIETSVPTGIAGAPVIFTAVHATGTGLSYTWDFGDGTISTKSVGAGDSAVVTHTYAAAGNYTVKVTATNTSGSATAQKVFAVVATQRKVFVPLVMRQ